MSETSLGVLLEVLPGALADVRRGPQGREVLDWIDNPRSLRASCASLLREAGVGIRALQELLGHRQRGDGPIRGGPPKRGGATAVTRRPRSRREANGSTYRIVTVHSKYHRFVY
jgi:hypothetical protein